MAYCQDPEVIQLSVPSEQKKVLIDSLMLATKFEDYFNEYCTAKIDWEGKEKGWSASEIQQRKAKIDFVEFMDYTAYNFFSAMKEDEIRLTIQLMNLLYKDKNYLHYVFTISSIETNLELFIKSHYLKD